MRALAFLVPLLVAAPVAASPADWLDGLYRRVGADLAAGKPLVATVHVALCSNDQIRCGGHGLGDPDSLRTNLYWATTGGFDGWFSRRGAGWKRVAETRLATGDVLARVVWRRTVEPDAAWRRYGVTKPFALYVVAEAWRGGAIDRALDRFVDDVYGDAADPVPLDDGTTLAAGGASHVVAYVGHDRFMDRPPYDFAAAAKRAGRVARPKGFMAIACATADYLAGPVPSESRVPLVLTTDLMFASSPAFDASLRAFAEARGFAALRTAAATGYATEQEKPVARCASLFTNPSHARWPGAR